MRKDNRYAFNNAYYKRSYRNVTEGSAAKVERIYDEEVEEFEEEEEPEIVETARPEREQERRSREDVENVIGRKVKYHRTYKVHFFSSFFILAIIAVFFICAARYISKQADMNLVEKQISAAKAELSEIEAKNAMLENQLNKEIDRNVVFTTACVKLKMQYPDNNEVINYVLPDEGYVKQYGAIPTAK